MDSHAVVLFNRPWNLTNEGGGLLEDRIVSKMARSHPCYIPDAGLGNIFIAPQRCRYLEMV